MCDSGLFATVPCQFRTVAIEPATQIGQIPLTRTFKVLLTEFFRRRGPKMLTFVATSCQN